MSRLYVKTKTNMRAFVLCCLGSLLIAAVYCSNVSAQDSEAKIIKSTPFVLSEEAVAAGIDGSLTVSFTVTKEGDVKDVMTVAGPHWPCGKSPDDEIKRVREAVEANIETIKFSPAMKDGKPQSSDMMLAFAIGEMFKNPVSERAAQKDKNAKPKLVKAGMIADRAVKLPKPDYPSEARRSRLTGPVRVGMIVDEKGNVRSAGILNGPKAFHRSAREAACGSKFSPTILHGTPVKVAGFLIYNFVP